MQRLGTAPVAPVDEPSGEAAWSARAVVGLWLRTHAWQLACSAAVAMIGMALSFVDFPFFASGRWFVAGDDWYVVLQARFVYFGATGAVYEHNVATSALPGLAVLYAPAVALGDHLGLVQGVPYFVAHPTMWLTVGPVAFAVGSVLLWGVDALAAELDVPASRRRLLAATLGVLVVVPVVELAGHPEDCATLGLLCFALAAHLRGEHHKVGWWLAAAILMQTWVLLACPLLLFATPRGKRFAMAARAASFPLIVFAVCLAADPADTWRQVVAVQPMTRTGQHTPWYGIAPRLASYRRVAGASSRRWGTLLSAAGGTAIALRRPSPRATLLAASAILLVRPLFETSDWGYFSMPGLVLALVIAARDRSRSWYVLLGAVVVLSEPTYGYAYFPRIPPWIFFSFVAVANFAVLWATTRASRRAFRRAPADPAPVAVAG